MSREVTGLPAPVGLDQVIASLPPEEQALIERRTQELRLEAEALEAIRSLAELSREQLRDSLEAGIPGAGRPTVSEIERHADLYLSTLRRFIEAAGGEMELLVRLPGRSPLKLAGTGDLRDA